MAMAPHSSTLAWKIPQMEEPGGLQSMGSQSRTQLSDFTFTFHCHTLEKAMATHSSVLAWRIPGMGEPGGLPSTGSHRVGHDWSNLATVAAAFILKNSLRQSCKTNLCWWTSSIVVYLGKSFYHLHFWKTTFLRKVFLVGRFLLSSVWIYHLSLSCPARFIVRNPMIFLRECLIFVSIYFSLDASKILSLSWL